MFDAGIKAFSLTVLLLVFSIQWQQCVSTAEDFPSDASSAGDDFISYNQQSLSTENALLGDNFNDLENYDQNESEKENDTFDEDSEVVPSQQTKQKSFKDIEDWIIYGDTEGDVIVKEFNDGRWEDDRKESIDTLRTTVSPSTTSTTTAATSTTSTLKPVRDESDSEEDVEEFRGSRSRTNDYKDWLTNRKRRAHSTFEKYKAYHRNYRRYGHKGHKKAFGRYKKYEHHRSKHKNSQLHHHQHQHRNHFHYSTFDDKPYYQGQVSYYGQDDDTMDDTGIGVVVADKPFHLPAKMRSYQHYRQYRRSKGSDGNIANSYRSDKYPNRSVKWPHLQRIEYQITKDEHRKLDPDDDDEDQLPPYIRKYNRRNKQLLDLLEGTMLPSTTTTMISVVPARVQYSEYEATSGGKDIGRKHDGVGHKSGRSHFHNHRNPKWIMEDLFEEQRANPNNPNIDEDQYLNDSAMPSQPSKSTEVKGSSQNSYKNTFKGKDFSDEDEDSNESVSKANEDENTILIEKNELPSGSVVNTSLNPDKKSSASGEKSQIASSFHPKDLSDSHSSISKSVAASAVDASPTETLKISPKANQFIYHRVASPRSVGTGTNIIGVDGGARKQRLPFVAITDRRLEMSKMQKQPADFRQNHLPLP